MLSIGDVDHSIYVTPNSREIEINGIVECDNDIVKYFLSKDFSHLWIVELDTVVPKYAFKKLFDLDVDIALGYYPSHRDYNRLIAGWVGEDAKIYYLPRTAVKGQILRGWVFAGTGCMLVKRRVFESGIRFRYNPDVGGPDVCFMFDSLRRGFTAALHGDVECGHLPEWPLTEDKKNDH